MDDTLWCGGIFECFVNEPWINYCINICYNGQSSLETCNTIQCSLMLESATYITMHVVTWNMSLIFSRNSEVNTLLIDVSGSRTNVNSLETGNILWCYWIFEPAKNM